MGGLIEVTSRAAKASLQRTVPVTSRLIKEAGAAGPQRPLGLARMYDLIGGGGRSGQREQPVWEPAAHGKRAVGTPHGRIKQYGQKLILKNTVIQNPVRQITDSLNSPYLSVVALQLKSLNVNFNSFDRNVHCF